MKITHDLLERAWNAKADKYNQWHELGLDEKIEFAAAYERRACEDRIKELNEQKALLSDMNAALNNHYQRALGEREDLINVLRAVMMTAVVQNRVYWIANGLGNNTADGKALMAAMEKLEQECG